MQKALIRLDGQEIELPVVVGSEGEKGIDITTLRSRTGYITLDPGYGNTGSCTSDITFIDGEKGILRYRGIPIEVLAEKSDFTEVADLLIWGSLPNAKMRERFSRLLADHAMIHENLKHHFEGFPWSAHPMAMLSAMVNALSCYHPVLALPHGPKQIEQAAAILISKVRTLAAFAHRMTRGEPFVYPDPGLDYAANFLHMMFSLPHRSYEAPPEIRRAMDLIFMLHADHEQNCSTSTVRMVASSGANLFASVSAGIAALWGPLHGGANQAVIEMLENIRKGGMDPRKCIEMAKDKSSGFRLMGFGHRVYKNYDPRARILKALCPRVLATQKRTDPLLEIAQELEALALEDDYFIERKLYPNVDFYSGIILRAIGIPTVMYPVIFAIGRLPGWIAHWRELVQAPGGRIARPRQIYTGPSESSYVPLADRPKRQGPDAGRGD